jgi:hypothetical protein
MNMRLIHIFFKISKAKRQFVLLFRLFLRVVNLKLFFQFCELKQKQFHVCTKRVNSQTNCLIALEILNKKMALSCIYFDLFSCTKMGELTRVKPTLAEARQGAERRGASAIVVEYSNLA